jgi:hypothetical protein
MASRSVAARRRPVAVRDRRNGGTKLSGAREEIGAHLGEFHIGPGFVQQQPAAADREIEPGLVFGRAGLVLEQKRSIDQFDVNARVLRRFDRIGDLDQLARGFLRITVGPISGEFNRWPVL